MPVIVVVGGQYGSEGKGKMVSYLSCLAPSVTSVVRCGGSNAGHTAQGFGRLYKLRQLPCGVVADECRLYLAAGMYIDLDVLMEEIKTCNVSPQRLCIDRNASVITGDDARQEVKAQLQQRLGSTLSGTGAATARKVLRCANVTLAASVPELHLFVGDVSAKLNEAIDRGDTVIVEGTQGFGLSLHHSDHFPFVTSRDTTAAAFLSDVGISPLLVTDIVLVLRTYPIRVSGFSGPMYKEISWEEVSQRSGSPARLAEYTTVTGKLRRVGEFDWELARRAVRVNRPTALAIHAIDYLDHNDFGKRSWEDLTQAGRGFVLGLEETLGVRVRYVFTGPEADYIIDRG